MAGNARTIGVVTPCRYDDDDDYKFSHLEIDNSSCYFHNPPKLLLLSHRLGCMGL